jgi:superfamily II DNA/RNA helicase
MHGLAYQPTSITTPCPSHPFHTHPNRSAAWPPGPWAVLLAPTRELALQLAGTLAPFLSLLGPQAGPAGPTLLPHCALCTVGGQRVGDDLHILASRGVDVLVATPGRLGDLVRRGAVRLNRWAGGSLVEPCACLWRGALRVPFRPAIVGD